MATAICKLMYNITIHMTGYGVRILLTELMPSLSQSILIVGSQPKELPTVLDLGEGLRDVPSGTLLALLGKVRFREICGAGGVPLDTPYLDIWDH